MGCVNSTSAKEESTKLASAKQLKAVDAGPKQVQCRDRTESMGSDAVKERFAGTSGPSSESCSERGESPLLNGDVEEGGIPPAVSLDETLEEPKKIMEQIEAESTPAYDDQDCAASPRKPASEEQSPGLLSRIVPALKRMATLERNGSKRQSSNPSSPAGSAENIKPQRFMRLHRRKSIGDAFARAKSESDIVPSRRASRRRSLTDVASTASRTPENETWQFPDQWRSGREKPERHSEDYVGSHKDQIANLDSWQVFDRSTSRGELAFRAREVAGMEILKDVGSVGDAFVRVRSAGNGEIWAVKLVEIADVEATQRSALENKELLYQARQLKRSNTKKKRGKKGSRDITAEAIDLSKLMEGLNEDVGEQNSSSEGNETERTSEGNGDNSKGNATECGPSGEEVRSSVKAGIAMFEMDDNEKTKAGSLSGKGGNRTGDAVQKETDTSDRSRDEVQEVEVDDKTKLGAGSETNEKGQSATWRKYQEMKKLTVEIKDSASSDDGICGTKSQRETRTKLEDQSDARSDVSEDTGETSARASLLDAVLKAQDAANAGGWEEDEFGDVQMKFNSPDMRLLTTLLEELDSRDVAPRGSSVSDDTASTPGSARSTARHGSPCFKSSPLNPNRRPVARSLWAESRYATKDKQVPGGTEPVDGKNESGSPAAALFDPNLLEIYEAAFEEYSPEEWKAAPAAVPRRRSLEVWVKAVAKATSKKMDEPAISEVAETALDEDQDQGNEVIPPIN